MLEDIGNIDESFENRVKVELVPLLDLYILLFKSDYLFKYLDCLFDHKTLISSSNYLDIMEIIIQDMDGYEIVSNYFVELLGENDFLNEKNYLFTVFNFDNPRIKSEVFDLSKLLSDVQFNNLNNSYRQVLKNKYKNLSRDNFLEYITFCRSTLNNKIESISEMIGGSLTKATTHKLNKSSNKLPRPLTILSFEVFSGKTFKVKEYTASYSKVLDQILDDLDVKYSKELSRKDKKVAKNNLKNSMNRLLANQFLHTPNKQTKFYTTILVNSELSVNIDYSNFNKDIKFDGDISTKNFFIKNKTDEIISSSNQTHLDYSSSVINFNNRIILLNSLSMLVDLENVFSILYKMVVGGNIDRVTFMSAIGSVLGILGGIVDVMSWKNLNQTVSLFNSRNVYFPNNQSASLEQGLNKSLKRYSYFATGILIVNALVICATSYLKYSKNSKHNSVIAAAHIVSATTSVLSTIAFYFGRTGWGVALSIVLLVIDFVIKEQEKKKLGNFLKECKWGIHNQNWKKEDVKVKYLFVIE